MLKPIPEELQKKGVRWVFAKKYENSEWEKAVLVGEENDFIKGKRFKCLVKNDVSKLVYFKDYEEWISCVEIKKIHEPQEPKKIPYTAETFPDNAIKIRYLNTKVEYSIITKEKLYILCFSKRNTYFFEDINENIEIGCQVIEDGEIKIEWRKFYQIKE